MSLVKRLLIILLLLLVFFGAISFALNNKIPVPLNLLFIELAEQSLALWILSSFVLGGLVGLAASAGLLLGVKKSEFAIRQKLRRSQEELKKLKTTVVKN